MAGGGQLFQIRLNRPSADNTWGFRLAGGQDYQAPISIQSVSQQSIAERSGLQPGDIIVRINGVDISNHDHQQAKMEIVRSGNDLEFTIQRGGMSVWQPKTVMMAPQQQQNNINHMQTRMAGPSSNSPQGFGAAGDPNIPRVSQTSLAANQSNSRHVGGDYNRSPKPFQGFGYQPPADTITQGGDGRTKRVFHNNYNSPMGLYAEQGVEQAYGAGMSKAGAGGAGNFKSVQAPTTSNAPVGRPQQQSMYCGACGDMIKGIFVKVQGRVLMHPECLKCVKCGVGLRQAGYFFVEGKLYCETHARQVAQPPEPGLKPMAVYK